MEFMAKHGAELHFIRPDAVHRSSVLQAIPGFQPVSNAHNITARFTAVPQFTTAMELNGYGLRGVYGYGLGVPRPSLLDRLRARWAEVVARIRAKQTMRLLPAPVAVAPVAAPRPLSPGQMAPSSGAGQYGVGPAKENMAKVGAMITAGSVRSGEDAMPPGVARPPLTAGVQIAPGAFDQFAQLAQMVRRGQPAFVGQSAYEAAAQRWVAARRAWF